MSKVLDFCGLTSGQLENGSILLGGSSKSIVRVSDKQIGSSTFCVNWSAVRTVVVKGGDLRIERILGFVHEYVEPDAYEVAVVIENWLGNFRLIAKRLPIYNHETDDFAPGNFHPLEYHDGAAIVLPWRSRRLEDIKNFRGVITYIELEDFFMRFAISCLIGYPEPEESVPAVNS